MRDGLCNAAIICGMACTETNNCRKIREGRENERLLRGNDRDAAEALNKWRTQLGKLYASDRRKHTKIHANARWKSQMSLLIVVQLVLYYEVLKVIKEQVTIPKG